MEKKVILLNGPPSSGKDTAAIILSNFIGGKSSRSSLTPYRVRMLKFADPLKRAAHALYGIPQSCEYFEREFGNIWKNEPQAEFFGEKPRDVYVGLSEDFAKLRNGGKRHFGKIAARSVSLEKHDNCFIFSDSGFAEEAIPVIEAAGIANVIVYQLERPGCNFSSDSRGYIARELIQQFPKLRVQEIPNIGDKMLFRTMLQAAAMTNLELEIKDGNI